MNINKRIELNRLASIGNFERIFNVLENNAWNIALPKTQKEREFKFVGFTKNNDIAKESVMEIINSMFDLHQAIDAMPKEVQNAIWKKCWEVQTEREMLDEEDDEDWDEK